MLDLNWGSITRPEPTPQVAPVGPELTFAAQPARTAAMSRPAPLRHALRGAFALGAFALGLLLRPSLAVAQDPPAAPAQPATTESAPPPATDESPLAHPPAASDAPAANDSTEPQAAASTPAPPGTAAPSTPAATEPTQLLPPRRAKRPWKRHDQDLQGTALRAFGLRVGGGSLSPDASGDGTDHPVGLTLAERGVGLLDYGVLDARYLDYLEFGEDTQGWTYRADGQLSLGPRWAWTRWTAGVLRAGARAHIARSGHLFTSDVRAPFLDLGVRHSSADFQLDAVAEVAPVLAGYVEPAAQSFALRKSQAVAGLLSFTWSGLRLDAEVTRYYRPDGPDVSEGRAWACGFLGWGFVCLDGRVLQVAGSEDTREATGYSLGLSALAGQYDWLHGD